jgi:hypothetical protein
MGFLSRLTSAVRSERTFKSESSEGSISLTCEVLAAGALRAVVGESFYQSALERTAAIAGRGKPPLPVAVSVADDEPELLWFQAVLMREPDNPYDSNAIAVYSPAGKIGHLGREDAEEYQDVLIAVEEGGAHGGACSAFLRTGSLGIWGVVLALSVPHVCLDELET